MITLLDYYPNASHDSEKYSISLSSLGIDNPTLSKVYFGLLYKALSYSTYELRISTIENDKALLVGDIPLLSIKDIPTIDEYNIKILNPYQTWSEEFAVRLVFTLVISSTFFSTNFSTIAEMTQLINWNSSDVLIYRYPDYFPDWDNISGKEILSYLLHIGLVFRDNKTFSIFYTQTPINRFIEGVIVTYTEYRFYLTFKLAIPEYFNQFTAQEVV